MSIFSSTWYTDLVDIFRIENYVIGNASRQARMPKYQQVPCRIYRSGKARIQETSTDSTYSPYDMLAVDTSVDIQIGDELIVTRGGRLGKGVRTERYFAGDPNDYFEPYGQISPQLDHKEIPLGATNRIGEGVK